MQDNMSQEDVGKVEAFIQNEEPCDFCTLSERNEVLWRRTDRTSLHGFKRSFCRDVHR